MTDRITLNQLVEGLEHFEGERYLSIACFACSIVSDWQGHVMTKVQPGVWTFEHEGRVYALHLRKGGVAELTRGEPWDFPDLCVSKTAAVQESRRLLAGGTPAVFAILKRIPRENETSGPAAGSRIFIMIYKHGSWEAYSGGLVPFLKEKLFPEPPDAPFVRWPGWPTRARRPAPSVAVEGDNAEPGPEIAWPKETPGVLKKHYACSGCGAKGLKLWAAPREQAAQDFQEFYSGVFCWRCLGKRTKVDTSEIDDQGNITIINRTAIIENHVPAIMGSFDWWSALPTRLDADSVPPSPSLRERLEEIERQTKALEKERRGIYRASLEAPEEEKVVGDVLASMLGEDDLFPSMSFPIEVSGIHWGEGLSQGLSREQGPCLVAIRPVDDEKTYLGIYVGDLPLGVGMSYHPDSGVLTVKTTHTNPAIVVPALGRVVMGVESWWGKIKSEADFRKITDQTIQDLWYVKALREMCGNGEPKGQG